MVVFGSDLREEAQGCIVFDPNDGGQVVEEVRQQTAVDEAKVFAVFGAGRGVGATTLALHLSAASARDHPTCFVDLDLEWGVAPRLGIASDHLTWAELGAGEDATRLVALPVAGGFRALLAPRNEEDGTSPDDVTGLLRRAADSFDRLFVDCPLPRLRRAAIDRADATVLVVPPTPPGARRALSVLETFPAARWAIVLNRLGPGGETTRAELQRILKRRCALELPCTPAIRDAEDDGKLLSSSWSRYGWRVAKLLEALERVF